MKQVMDTFVFQCPGMYINNDNLAEYNYDACMLANWQLRKANNIIIRKHMWHKPGSLPPCNKKKSL